MLLKTFVIMTFYKFFLAFKKHYKKTLKLEKFSLKNHEEIKLKY